MADATLAMMKCAPSVNLLQITPYQSQCAKTNNACLKVCYDENERFVQSLLIVLMKKKTGTLEIMGWISYWYLAWTLIYLNISLKYKAQDKVQG